jgi:hypothetical protein
MLAEHRRWFQDAGLVTSTQGGLGLRAAITLGRSEC